VKRLRLNWTGALAIGVGVGVALLTASGSINTASAAQASFTPTFSANGLDEGTTFTAVFNFTGTEYGGFPAPLTQLAVRLPVGVGGSDSGFATCGLPVLEAHEISMCPPGSIAGPSGQASLIVAFDATRVRETATVRAFFGPEDNPYFFMVGTSPVNVEALIPTTYRAGTPSYGRVLSLEIPMILTAPEAPYVSITRLALSLGTSGEEGNRRFTASPLRQNVQTERSYGAQKPHSLEMNRKPIPSWRRLHV
jgi:hypothetical protein